MGNIVHLTISNIAGIQFGAKYRYAVFILNSKI